MNLHLEVKGFDLTQAIENYLNKKLKNIRKFTKRARGKHEIWIELSKTTKHHKKGSYFQAKIDIEMKNRTIHAQERGESIYEAIDKMEADINRELKHYKDKYITKERKQARIWKRFLRLSPLARRDMRGKRDKEEGI
jgi:ribosomal subunit interface protein